MSNVTDTSTRKIRRALLAACSSLAIAGAFTACSSTSGQAQETVTVTDSSSASEQPGTAETTQTAESTATATATATETETTTETTTDGEQSKPPTGEVLQQGLLNALRGNVKVNEKFTIGRYELDACVVGDGYALNIVAAGEATSCEFAREVMDIQTEGLNPTGDNIRDHLEPSIEAHSPATGKTYNVSCSEDMNHVITCTGGDNARIFMY